MESDPRVCEYCGGLKPPVLAVNRVVFIKANLTRDLCEKHTTEFLYDCPGSSVVKRFEKPDATKKPSNPKDAVGSTKAPFSTVPAQVVGELGLAMLEGALKYGRHNYRVVGVRTSVYYDAARRHLDAYWEGQDIDPDSGLPHLVKAMACLAVLRDSTIQGNLNDDRPPKNKHQNWVSDLNAQAKALIEKYPNPEKPYTEVGFGNTKKQAP